MRTFRHVFIACFAVLLSVGGYVYWQTHAAQPQVTSPRPVAHRRIKPAAAHLPAMSLTPGAPTELHIAKLGIEAPIEPVGINKSGEMIDPHNAIDATWYQYGYAPGALGNAVLAGHYLYESKPALFYRLRELAPGDGVSVTNDQQTTIEFRVTDNQHYSAEDAPFAEIFGASKKAQLQLVTCYGAWDRVHQRYIERLVVTAEFIKESPSSSVEH